MKKKAVSLLLALLLTLGLCTTSWAAEDNTYLDETGEAQPIPEGAVTVTQDTIPAAPWSAGWYVIRGTVTLTETLKTGGAVNLVLTDGCELKADKGINSLNQALAIYGQSGGSGKLTVGYFCWHSTRLLFAGIYGSNVAINGGNISITVAEPTASECWGMNVDAITVNGGHLSSTVTGGANTAACVGIGGNPISINGGSVTTDAGSATRMSWGLLTVNNVNITSGSLAASAVGETGTAIHYDRGSGSVVPGSPAFWWRTAKDGAYATEETWDVTAFQSGLYAELTTTDPTPVKHYYYAPTETEETIEAPKTADPGVVVYGVMTVSALLGMGVVKKKAF